MYARSMLNIHYTLRNYKPIIPAVLTVYIYSICYIRSILGICGARAIRSIRSISRIRSIFSISRIRSI